MELPIHWQKFNKTPFDYQNPQLNAVYIMALFENKRAVLINKDLKVLCTFETRKVALMLQEARDAGWVHEEYSDSNVGERPVNYPTRSKVSYWIEMNKP